MILETKLVLISLLAVLTSHADDELEADDELQADEQSLGAQSAAIFFFLVPVLLLALQTLKEVRLPSLFFFFFITPITKLRVLYPLFFFLPPLF